MLPIPHSLLNLVYDLLNYQLLKNEPVFEEKSVHELLWGYNDTLLFDAEYIINEINIFLKKHDLNGTLHIPDVNPLIHLQVICYDLVLCLLQYSSHFAIALEAGNIEVNNASWDCFGGRVFGTSPKTAQ